MPHRGRANQRSHSATLSLSLTRASVSRCARCARSCRAAKLSDTVEQLPTCWGDSAARCFQHLTGRACQKGWLSIDGFPAEAADSPAEPDAPYSLPPGRSLTSVDIRLCRCGIRVATACVMPTTQSFNPPALFRTILSPVDFSDHSAVALKYAAILAKRSAGRLHVFHVNDPMLAAAAAVAFADPDYAKVALGELRPFVAKTLPENMRKAISIRYAVDTGDPSRLIASAATKLGCDLIVMGTHGLSGLDKVLIGSTTERMLRRASVPLLAVPSLPGGAHGAQAPGREWPGAAILVPVDLGEQSTRDLRDAELIARAFGTAVVLVHVVPPLQAPPWYRADLAAHHRMLMAKAQRQLESLATTVAPGVKIETRALAGRPADEIAALAAEERIGLVVMHRRKGPGLFGSRAGSIASHVLRHAVTPVLALPDRAMKNPRMSLEPLARRKRGRSLR